MASWKNALASLLAKAEKCRRAEPETSRPTLPSCVLEPALSQRRGQSPWQAVTLSSRRSGGDCISGPRAKARRSDEGAIDNLQRLESLLSLEIAACMSQVYHSVAVALIRCMSQGGCRTTPHCRAVRIHFTSSKVDDHPCIDA